MRKRTSPTMLERTIVLVPEFEKVLKKLDNQVICRAKVKAHFPIMEEGLPCLVFIAKHMRKSWTIFSR